MASNRAERPFLTKEERAGDSKFKVSPICVVRNVLVKRSLLKTQTIIAQAAKEDAAISALQVNEALTSHYFEENEEKRGHWRVNDAFDDQFVGRTGFLGQRELNLLRKYPKLVAPSVPPPIAPAGYRDWLLHSWHASVAAEGNDTSTMSPEDMAWSIEQFERSLEPVEVQRAMAVSDSRATKYTEQLSLYERLFDVAKAGMQYVLALLSTDDPDEIATTYGLYEKIEEDFFLPAPLPDRSGVPNTLSIVFRYMIDHEEGGNMEQVSQHAAARLPFYEVADHRLGLLVNLRADSQLSDRFKQHFEAVPGHEGRVVDRVYRLRRGHEVFFNQETDELVAQTPRQQQAQQNRKLGKGSGYMSSTPGGSLPVPKAPKRKSAAGRTYERPRYSFPTLAEHISRAIAGTDLVNPEEGWRKREQWHYAGYAASENSSLRSYELSLMLGNRDTTDMSVVVQTKGKATVATKTCIHCLRVWAADDKRIQVADGMNKGKNQASFYSCIKCVPGFASTPFMLQKIFRKHERPDSIQGWKTLNTSEMSELEEFWKRRVEILSITPAAA